MDEADEPTRPDRTGPLRRRLPRPAGARHRAAGLDVRPTGPQLGGRRDRRRLRRGGQGQGAVPDRSHLGRGRSAQRQRPRHLRLPGHRPRGRPQHGRRRPSTSAAPRCTRRADLVDAAAVGAGPDLLLPPRHADQQPPQPAQGHAPHGRDRASRRCCRRSSPSTWPPASPPSRPSPVSVGAGEILTFEGRGLPNLPPTGLRDVLTKPAAPLSGCRRCATSTSTGCTACSRRAAPRRSGSTSTAWRSRATRPAASATSCSDNLSAITSDRGDGPILAAATLIKMNVVAGGGHPHRLRRRQPHRRGPGAGGGRSTPPACSSSPG